MLTSFPMAPGKNSKSNARVKQIDLAKSKNHGGQYSELLDEDSTRAFSNMLPVQSSKTREKTGPKGHGFTKAALGNVKMST